jgi:hypothetical protein
LVTQEALERGAGVSFYDAFVQHLMAGVAHNAEARGNPEAPQKKRKVDGSAAAFTKTINGGLKLRAVILVSAEHGEAREHHLTQARNSLAGISGAAASLVRLQVLQRVLDLTANPWTARRDALDGLEKFVVEKCETVSGFRGAFGGPVRAFFKPYAGKKAYDGAAKAFMKNKAGYNVCKPTFVITYPHDRI